MSVSSRKIVEWMLLFLAVVFSILGFFSVSVSVFAETGRWLAPSVWFSLLSVTFLSAGVLYRERSMRVAFVVCSVVPSLLFTQTLSHILIVLISVGLLLSGFRKMEGDLVSRIALSLRKSMSAGAFMFIVPVSMLIASQYYAEMRTSSWQDLVPRFSLAEGSGDFVLRAAGSISPEIARIRDERMTVDAFLLMVRETNGYSGNSMDVLMNDMSATLSVEAGRVELGKLVGRNLSGNERMQDVLSEALRNKMIAFLSGEKAERSLPNGALPLFLSMLLFITIFSVASLLQSVWTLLAAGILRFLIRIGVLTIERVPVEQEIIR